jgi:hypothetical protein
MLRNLHLHIGLRSHRAAVETRPISRKNTKGIKLGFLLSVMRLTLGVRQLG